MRANTGNGVRGDHHSADTMVPEIVRVMVTVTVMAVLVFHGFVPRAHDLPAHHAEDGGFNNLYVERREGGVLQFYATPVVW